MVSQLNFAEFTGTVQNNPVAKFIVHGDEQLPINQQALNLCRTGSSLYVQGKTHEALQHFVQAAQLSSDVQGIYYAQGICLAKLGQLEDAIEPLNQECLSPLCHPNTRQVLQDIQGWLNKHQVQINASSQPLSKSPKISIFTTAKPFQGSDKIRQINALNSWKLLQPTPEIILLGNEEGNKSIAREFELCHESDVDQNEYGTPLISGLFQKAQQMASNDILVYINADIILLSDFLPAIQQASQKFKKFLMVGQRWDTEVNQPINFNHKTWETQLRQHVKNTGSLHAPTGIDYLIFTKNLWSEIPPFAVGRAAWDISMVYRALAAGYPVIDATAAITAVHQNHDYTHLAGGQTQAWKGIEAQRNHKLAGGAFPKGIGSGGIGYISDATWKLTSAGLVTNTPRVSVPSQAVKTPVSNDDDHSISATSSASNTVSLEQIISTCYEQLKQQPNSAETYKSLGNALQAQGQSEAAIRAYQKAIQINPKFAEAHANLGNMAYLQGKLYDAIVHYKTAIQIQPNLAGVYLNLSIILQKQGHVQEAAFYQQKAVGIQPDLKDKIGQS
jgi:tetratricopeptide (TPR) repeat protein